jgi:hypothetical protein
MGFTTPLSDTYVEFYNIEVYVEFYSVCWVILLVVGTSWVPILVVECLGFCDYSPKIFTNNTTSYYTVDTQNPGQRPKKSQQLGKIPNKH